MELDQIWLNQGQKHQKLHKMADQSHANATDCKVEEVYGESVDPPCFVEVSRTGILRTTDSDPKSPRFFFDFSPIWLLKWRKGPDQSSFGLELFIIGSFRVFKARYLPQTMVQALIDMIHEWQSTDCTLGHSRSILWPSFQGSPFFHRFTNFCL